jgi:hypothetical protein
MGHSQSKSSARSSKSTIQQPLPSNSPQKFTYTPLAGPRNFRILHLARHREDLKLDHEDLELHASLVEASLDKVPEYFALSYTWGDPTPSHKIVINGRVLGITQNCADALRRMLRGKAERLIWVDSICINQGGMYLRHVYQLMFPASVDILQALQRRRKRGTDNSGLWTRYIARRYK